MKEKTFLEKIKDKRNNKKAENISNLLKNKEITIQEIPEPIKIIILRNNLIEEQEIIYNLLESIETKEEQQTLIKEKININDMTISEINKIPEKLRIEAIKNGYNNFYTNIGEIINNITDENLYKLINDIPHIRDYMNNGEIFIYDDVRNCEEYKLYIRIKKIENENIINNINSIINIEKLEKKIDNGILEEKEKLTTNYYHIINEKNKIKVIEETPIKEAREIVSKYNNLTEEGKKITRNILFSEENINKLLKEVNPIYKTDLTSIIKDYITKDETDLSKLKSLFIISTEISDIDTLSEAREMIFDRLDDETKAEILLNNNNTYFNNTAGVSLSNLGKLLLINKISNKEIYLSVLKKYLTENENAQYYLGIFKEYINMIEDQNKIDIIDSFSEITDSRKTEIINICIENIKEEQNIIKALSTYLQINDINYTAKEKLIKKIIMNTENLEILKNNIDLKQLSNNNILTLINKAIPEVSKQILMDNPWINENIQNLYQNHNDKLKTLTKKITSEEDLEKFYDQIIKENPNELGKKLALLMIIQKDHETIGATVNLKMLEDDILKNFGGIDGIEKILRYPKTQEQILKMSEQSMQVIGTINKYLNENLKESNYCFNTILEKNYSGQYNYINEECIMNIHKYMTNKKEITTEDKNKIFNIINLPNDIKELINNKNPNSIDEYISLKDKICDQIITEEYSEELLKLNINKYISKKDAYLLKHYNITEKEAAEKVASYEKYIKSLPNTKENIYIKKYINELKNILNSNDTIIKVAYNKNQETKNRIELEKLEEHIKLAITTKMEETLYDPQKQQQEKTKTINYEGQNIEIYQPETDFNMLVSVLDAYGGGTGVYENYYEQWNTNEHADNQRICTTYIGNKNLSTAKRNNCVIMGFNNISDASIVKMAPYDIVSKNDEYVTKNHRQAKFMTPEELINETRRYNEIDIERENQETEKKRQPSYIVSFADSIEEIEEEQKKAAIQFQIPIILINREQIAKQELQKIMHKLETFIETKNPNLINQIIEDYCTNKISTRTTIKDQKDQEQTNLRNYEEEYFNNQKLKEIINVIIETAKEEKNNNEELSNTIIEELKKAMKKENEKAYSWQREFGAEYLEGLFDEKIFQEEREKLNLYQSHETNILKEILEMDSDQNQKEFNQKCPQEERYYHGDSIKDYITNLAVQEKEKIKNSSQYGHEKLNYETQITHLYLKIIQDNIKKENPYLDILTKTYEELTEEEQNIKQALEMANTHEGNIYNVQEVCRAKEIPKELITEFETAIKIKEDLYILKQIVSGISETQKAFIDIKTEECKKLLKVSYQIREHLANKKIRQIINQEGFELQQEEIYQKLCEEKLPNEVAKTLEEVEKNQIYEELQEGKTR